MSTQFHAGPFMTIEPPIIAPWETAYAVMHDQHIGDCDKPVDEPGVVKVQGNVITVLYVSYAECQLESPYQSEYRYPITGLAPGAYEVQMLFCQEQDSGEIGPCGVYETDSLLVSQNAAYPVPSLTAWPASLLGMLLIATALLVRTCRR